MRSIFTLQHLTMKRTVLMSKVMSGCGEECEEYVCECTARCDVTAEVGDYWSRGGSMGRWRLGAHSRGVPVPCRRRSIARGHRSHSPFYLTNATVRTCHETNARYHVSTSYCCLCSKVNNTYCRLPTNKTTLEQINEYIFLNKIITVM